MRSNLWTVRLAMLPAPVIFAYPATQHADVSFCDTVTRVIQGESP